MIRQALDLGLELLTDHNAGGRKEGVNVKLYDLNRVRPRMTRLAARHQRLRTLSIVTRWGTPRHARPSVRRHWVSRLLNIAGVAVLMNVGESIRWLPRVMDGFSDLELGPEAASGEKS